jgi:hypothetical protein
MDNEFLQEPTLEQKAYIKQMIKGMMQVVPEPFKLVILEQLKEMVDEMVIEARADNGVS